VIGIEVRLNGATVSSRSVFWQAFVLIEMRQKDKMRLNLGLTSLS